MYGNGHGVQNTTYQQYFLACIFAYSSSNNYKSLNRQGCAAVVFNGGKSILESSRHRFSPSHLTRPSNMRVAKIATLLSTSLPVCSVWAVDTPVRVPLCKLPEQSSTCVSRLVVADQFH
jgi:hypothetical protein